MLEKDEETGLSIGNQPLPWDTSYQQKWLKFVAAFAARYESNPACSYVVMGGFMQNFNTTMAKIEEDATAMENLAKHPPAGYPGLVTSYPDFSAAYVPAAEKIIDGYVTSFPTTSLLLTMFSVIPGDVGIDLGIEIADWGRETYVGHVGTMVSTLYAVVHTTRRPPLTTSRKASRWSATRSMIRRGSTLIRTRFPCRPPRSRWRTLWKMPFRKAGNSSKFTKMI